MEVFRNMLSPGNWFPRAYLFEFGFGLIIKAVNILLGVGEV